MFTNYLKTAFRNLLKYRVYSCINVLGLAIGIACCILIFLYVTNELSYDRHHENRDRVYRLAADIVFGGDEMQLAVAPAPMAQALLDDYPEVVSAVRFRRQGSFLIKQDEQNYKEERIVFADNSIFEVFTIPAVEGDAESALTEPNTVIMSRATARKYFGAESAPGRSLIFDNTATYKVTGVYEDMPHNSHFHFDFIASLETLSESRNGNWLSNNFRTYVLLEEGANPSALAAKFPGMMDKYIGPQIQQILGVGLEEFRKSGSKVEYFLQPLPDIHLYSDLVAEFEANGNINYVFVFSAIAVLILVIACINFMNLSTARSANRAKEVGIRKVVGSYRRQLIGQFLVESFLLSFLSLVLAIGLVKLALPAFNNLAEQQLEISYLTHCASF
jgi:putative ABC transport system permease protein